MRAHPIYRKSRAFTVVELLVTMSILAILATIAFFSYASFSVSSRNAVRSTNIAELSKVVESSASRYGKLPDPDTMFWITYGSGKVWKQGIMGTGMVAMVSTNTANSITRPPLDPTSHQPYKYSASADSKRFEILGEIEKTSFFASNIPTVYAEDGTTSESVALVSGTYLGVATKTSVDGSGTCILATPSLLTSLSPTEGSVVNIQDGSLSGTIIINDKSTSGIAFNPQVVYCDPTGLPKDNSSYSLTEIGEKLQAAYASSPETANLLAIAPLETTGAALVRATGDIVN